MTRIVFFTGEFQTIRAANSNIFMICNLIFLPFLVSDRDVDGPVKRCQSFQSGDALIDPSCTF
jgi:hypothetical protein